MLVSAVLLSVVAVGPGPLSAPVHCRTAELWPPPPLRVPALGPRPRDLVKAERDAVGSFPNTLASQNFVLKWGDEGNVTAQEAGDVLDAFEYAWQTEVVGMGYAPPPGSDSYLFNVYLADTGSGTPPAYGSGAYYTVDPDGWPMIAVGLDVAVDRYSVESTAPHEFFHALEHATGSYAYDGAGAWYVEACAEWAAMKVRPDNPYVGSFVGAYALVPEYPLGYFDYPDTGAFLEFHQYGASIFPYFLSEQVADDSLIQRSWTEAGLEDDPLRVLDRLLHETDDDIETVFATFAAHTAVWDYAEGDLFRAWVRDFVDYFPAWDHRFAADVPSGGTVGGLVAPKAGTLPQRFGYNVVRLIAPDDGTLVVGFRGASVGSQGGASRFDVTVIRASTGSFSYTSVPLVDHTGEVRLTGVGAETGIYLTVAAFSDRETTGETFDYRFKMEFESVAVPAYPADSIGDEAGGCRSAPVSAATGLVLLTLMLRSRRSARAAV